MLITDKVVCASSDRVSWKGDDELQELLAARSHEWLVTLLRQLM